MTQSGLSSALFGNMPPPSHLVTLPPGREWVYECAAWAFVALAAASAGLWVVRRQTLRPAVRRALLWLAAGGLAVAFSCNWLWQHRDANMVPPGLVASVAVSMHAVWAVGAAVVVVVGWRRVRSGRGSPAFVGRALALALVTLAAAGLFAELDFRLALMVVLPGYLLAELVGGAQAAAVVVFFGANVVVWWAAWAFVLWVRNGALPDLSDPSSRSE